MNEKPHTKSYKRIRKTIEEEKQVLKKIEAPEQVIESLEELETWVDECESEADSVKVEVNTSSNLTPKERAMDRFIKLCDEFDDAWAAARDAARDAKEAAAEKYFDLNTKCRCSECTEIDGCSGVLHDAR